MPINASIFPAIDKPNNCKAIAIPRYFLLDISSGTETTWRSRHTTYMIVEFKCWFTHTQVSVVLISKGKQTFSKANVEKYS